MKVKTIRESKGIAYFGYFDDAVAFKAAHCANHPEARIVSYQLGYAVQTRKSGNYLNAQGKPSKSESDA